MSENTQSAENDAIRVVVDALLADQDFVDDVAATLVFGNNYVARAQERLDAAIPLVVSRTVAALGAGPQGQTLDDLRALAEAATPGPWGDPAEAHIGDYGWYVFGCPAGETEDSEQGRADAAYIAAANPATVLALLDRLARLESLTHAAERHIRPGQADQ